jgi:hypothetical protein
VKLIGLAGWFFRDLFHSLFQMFHCRAIFLMSRAFLFTLLPGKAGGLLQRIYFAQYSI